MGGLLFQQTGKDRVDTFNVEEDVEEQERSSFTEYLNSNILESKIKFTMETSRQELVFLDTKVHLKMDI